MTQISLLLSYLFSVVEFQFKVTIFITLVKYQVGVSTIRV